MVVVGDVIDVIVCLLVLSRLSCTVCGLPVGSWWSVKISWGVSVLEEEDSAVVGVFWPHLYSFRSIEYIKYTHPALAAILL